MLSSANSINWGRLAPQIVYYISAYCDLINSGDIKAGDEINVCVPTGNFGNIFAAYIARRAGLPLGKLVCASNRNNILTDFIKTGVYDRNRHFYTTISPSMDILISSNLERMLYLAAGSKRTAAYMSWLTDDGIYTIDDDIKTEFTRSFWGDFCGEENTSAMIKNVFGEYNYLIDTHTAVGLYCAQRYIEQTGDTRRMLTVSTASPYKFASDVYRSLTGSQFEDEFANINALSELTGTEIPAPLSCLTKKSIRFDPDSAIEAADMKDELFRTLGLS
jgi:threonine synthase